MQTSGVVRGERWVVDADRTNGAHVSVWFPDANIRVSSFGTPNPVENVRRALLAADRTLARREGEQADGGR